MKTSMLQPYKLIKQQKVKQLALLIYKAKHFCNAYSRAWVIRGNCRDCWMSFTVYLWNLFHWKIKYIVFVNDFDSYKK